jgi:hypothetical protein
VNRRNEIIDDYFNDNGTGGGSNDYDSYEYYESHGDV